MPRIKIDLPAHFTAAFSIPVRIGDINYGNHVGNDAIVAIMHEARMLFLKKHGYTELNIEGKGLIMADLSVEFKKESFYNDVIEVKIAFEDITSISFTVYYVLHTIRENSNVQIAKARTGMVCYDYQDKKIVPLPERFLSILSS